MPAGTLRDRNADILTPAELARRTYGSSVTAWLVKRDWEVLRQTG